MVSPALRPLPFRSLREVVADTLRQAILDGSLKPGQRIMDAEVAAQMGISRSPVREALRQLEKDGLVRSIPNRGTIVNDLSPDDLVELYGIRAVLEGLAARWACHSIQRAELEKLEGLARAMQGLLPFGTDDDRVSFLRQDVEFHQLLVASARAPRLTEILATIRLQIRMVMAAASVSAHGSAQAALEHVLMLDAIARADADEAERLARLHVLESKDRLLRLLDVSGSRIP